MLAETLRVQLGRDKYDFYCPNTLILCSNDRESAWAIEDCACAMENIMLAAQLFCGDPGNAAADNNYRL